MQSFITRSRHRLMLFRVVSLLAFTSLLSVAAAAEDGTSEQMQAAVDSSRSPEGQHIPALLMMLDR